MGTYKLSSQRRTEGSGSKKLREHRESTSSGSSKTETPAEYRAKVEAQQAAESQQATQAKKAREQQIINQYQSQMDPYQSRVLQPASSTTSQVSIVSETRQSVPSPVRPEYQAAYVEAQSTSPHQLYGSDPAAKTSITSTPNVDNGLNLPTETTPLSVEYSRLQDKVSEKIPTYDALISKRNEYELSHPTVLKAHTAVYDNAHQNENVGAAVDTFASFGKGVYSGVQEHPVDIALMVGMGALTGPAMGVLSKAPGVARAGAAVTKIPVVGNAIARYGAGVGLTGLYGLDLNSRITAPVLTDEGLERDPTTQEKAERFGTAVSTEIIPFTIGAGLTASATRAKIKNPIYEETPAQYEVMMGFEIQTTSTGSSTKIKTDLVDEALISLAERNRFSQVISQDERVLSARYSQAIIEDGITRTAPGRNAEVTLSRPLEVTGGQMTLENEAILSTRRGAWEIDFTIPAEPSAGKTLTIDQFRGTKFSEKVETPWESNTYKTISDNILLKQNTGKGSNVVDTSDSRLEFIRGRFTGEPIEVKPPELSGKTGKLQFIEKDGVQVLQEQSWTQAGVDQFRGIKLSEKVETPWESNSYKTIEGNLLAKIEKRNPLMDIKDPAADTVIQGSQNININIKPDKFRRTIPKENPPKIEIKDDVDIVLSSKTTSSKALSKDTVAEQIVGYRPASREIVGFSEVMGKARIPGISFTPASFQGIAQSQGLSQSLNESTSQAQKGIQIEGLDQTQTQDFTQDLLPRQTTRQKQTTPDPVPQISRSLASMEIPPVILPEIPNYTPRRKAAEKRSTKRGSGREKNLFNRYGNPLEVPKGLGKVFRRL